MIPQINQHKNSNPQGELFLATTRLSINSTNIALMYRPTCRCRAVLLRISNPRSKKEIFKQINNLERRSLFKIREIPQAGPRRKFSDQKTPHPTNQLPTRFRRSRRYTVRRAPRDKIPKMIPKGNLQGKDK